MSKKLLDELRHMKDKKLEFKKVVTYEDTGFYGLKILSIFSGGLIFIISLVTTILWLTDGLVKDDKQGVIWLLSICVGSIMVAFVFELIEKLASRRVRYKEVNTGEFK